MAARGSDIHGRPRELVGVTNLQNRMPTLSINLILNCQVINYKVHG